MYEQAIPATLQQSWEQSYPGTADQLRHVRRALREFLGACPVADDAVHLLSELCANAVLHTDSGKTGGTFTVRAGHVPNAYLYGEVQDAGSDWHGQLPASATHAHGLYLLQMLSSACGVHQINRAHLVWFRLDYPCRPAPHAAPRP
jgi:serine/threonine-protein kinase RsbW